MPSSSSPEYNTLYNIISRCYNSKNKSYSNYGARGIDVCDDWRFGRLGLTRYQAFLFDMGPRPSKHHSIERIDNSKGYSPDNCCWATKDEQVKNKRNNRLITAQGETKILMDWARILGISEGAILGRIRRGWSPEDAVTKSKFSNGTGEFAVKDQCIRGHSLSGDNVYFYKGKRMACKECLRINNRISRARKQKI